MRAAAILCVLGALPFAPAAAWAQAHLTCICDVQKPATLKERWCSLCQEAEKRPEFVLAFSLPDKSRRKPNRWLALPRTHTAGKAELLSDLDAPTRIALWREAIARAQFFWGERWGLAINGTSTRSQCHLHIHIGKLIDGVETPDFVAVDDVSQIPDPGEGGMWVHPVGGKLHVHRDPTAETVLMR
jgi:CDP-diacylglycerol pyrophosphatase